MLVSAKVTIIVPLCPHFPIMFCTFFLKKIIKFQPMMFAYEISSLSSNQDTNRFLKNICCTLLMNNYYIVPLK